MIIIIVMIIIIIIIIVMIIIIINIKLTNNHITIILIYNHIPLVWSEK